MSPKVTLTDGQKYEFCLYACDNKKTCKEYVEWIKQKWGVTVDESTITRILKSKEKRLAAEVINHEAKRHRSVTILKLELALKEFVLVYQEQTILSDAVTVFRNLIRCKSVYLSMYHLTCI